jgi:hypothetical protein
VAEAPTLPTAGRRSQERSSKGASATAPSRSHSGGGRCVMTGYDSARSIVHTFGHRSVTPPAGSNKRSGSTTWHWNDGSLRRAGRPEGTAASERSSAANPPLTWAVEREKSVIGLRARDLRKPLDMQIRWLGAMGRGQWEIRARGWRWIVPGDLALADVMNWINRTDGPSRVGGYEP